MISVLIVIGIVFSFIHGVNSYVERKLSCGLDKSKTSILYEGIADIHTYPWMGTLFYPFGKKKLTTSVVLVTKQIVIGAADEIEFLPKEDVRARSRVVLGHKCSGPFLSIRDYAFHPDYKRESYTALAMIQLEVDAIQQELRPICGPPTYFAEPNIYAIVNGHCKEGKVRVYKMEYVPQDKCEQYYRKSGLGLQKFWPKYSACAQTQSGGTCRWRSGTALVMKQDGRWRLLGFGVNGPGCEAPARFLDYGMHQQWVRNSVARIGRPAITRIADNHIIMRRTLNNLQRYGDCDREERRYVIYKDLIKIEGDKTATTTYNLTLLTDVEYSCIDMIAELPNQETSKDMSKSDNGDGESERALSGSNKPKIHLRRWCAGIGQMCFGFQYVEINLYVRIEFSRRVTFFMVAYGKEGKVIDPQKGLQYSNSWTRKLPVRDTKVEDNLLRIVTHAFAPTGSFHKWFYSNDISEK